ncbi:MAG: OB-fold domain-containing protein [Deltaproteobacteria bacterium]|nr:OB-fold domain-containing protein [Deltaproteobacteria bacterium]
MDAPRPVPQSDAVIRPFWEACARHSLCFQQCAACGHRWLPASVVCPRCWAAGAEWRQARGEGSVFSFAVYHRAYHPAFEPLLPYIVAVIELAEGPRLVSNIVGSAPGEVRVGAPVRLEFLDIGDAALPVFRLAPQGA